MIFRLDEEENPSMIPRDGNIVWQFLESYGQYRLSDGYVIPFPFVRMFFHIEGMLSRSRRLDAEFIS